MAKSPFSGQTLGGFAPCQGPDGAPVPSLQEAFGLLGKVRFPFGSRATGLPGGQVRDPGHLNPTCHHWIPCILLR